MSIVITTQLEVSLNNVQCLDVYAHFSREVLDNFLELVKEVFLPEAEYVSMETIKRHRFVDVCVCNSPESVLQ